MFLWFTGAHVESSKQILSTDPQGMSIGPSLYEDEGDLSDLADLADSEKDDDE